MKTRKLNLESLESRITPAEFIWIGNLSTNWTVGGNWREYDFATDTVGNAPAFAPTSDDIGFFDVRAQSDPTVPDEVSRSIMGIWTLADFDQNIHIIGDLALTASTAAANGVISRVTNELYIHGGGRLQIGNSRFLVKDEILNNEGALFGNIYVGYTGILELIPTFGITEYQVNITVGMAHPNLLGPEGTDPEDEDVGHLIVDIAADREVTFSEDNFVLIKPTGNSTIMWNEDSEITTHGLAHYYNEGTTTFQPEDGTEQLLFDLAVENSSGGTVKFLDSSNINFTGVAAPSLVSFYSAGTVIVGHQVTLELLNGTGTLQIDGGILTTYVSDTNTNANFKDISATFTGTIILDTAAVSTNTDNYGFFGATNWDITDSLFALYGSSTHDDFHFLIAADETITFGGSTTASITLVGNGNALQAGARWDFFETAASGQITGSVDIYTATMPPVGMTWISIAHDDDVDMDVEIWSLQLAEIIETDM